MQKSKLKIVGIASDDLMRKHKIFYSKAITPNEILLFCDYSSIDIPIGYEFNFIENSDWTVLFSGTIRLKEITQEFMLPYDQIPKGHKSICKFEFINTNVPKLLLDLPTISDWYESSQYLYFVQGNN
ncbi:hypothetical protein [Parafilimonas sp.]|uniref:hypothetical protein n=1 Tax=Parafilimonas sp. TaxID=1969739 RepID=UPI0039E508FB